MEQGVFLYNLQQMLWFVLTFIVAVCVATRDILFKRYANELSVLELSSIELFWSVPPLTLCLLFTPVPQLDPGFWWILLIAIPVNGLAYFLYNYAITISPVSLTVPFLSFTPAFLIIVGWVVLGEAVSFWGGVGIICIGLGSYVLNIDRVKDGLLQPILSLKEEKGPWVMLFVAFIFSFGAVLGKKGMQLSSPLFFTFLFFVIFCVVMLLFLSILGRLKPAKLIQCKYVGFQLGALLTVHVAFHGLAIMMTAAAYMVSVKRSSILLTVLLSWLFLKEEKIIARGSGALLMFLGILLIVLRPFG